MEERLQPDIVTACICSHCRIATDPFDSVSRSCALNCYEFLFISVGAVLPQIFKSPSGCAPSAAVCFMFGAGNAVMPTLAEMVQASKASIRTWECSWATSAPNAQNTACDLLSSGAAAAACRHRHEKLCTTLPASNFSHKKSII